MNKNKTTSKNKMVRIDEINLFLILPLLTILTLLLSDPLNFITGIMWCFSLSYFITISMFNKNWSFVN